MPKVIAAVSLACRQGWAGPATVDYYVLKISGAVSVTIQEPGKKALTIRAGEWINEDAAEVLAVSHDVSVVPYNSKK